MNFELQQLPNRTSKPRHHGLTMVMDKGMGLRQVQDFIEMAGGYTDLLKLGFGTSMISPHLEKKLALYREAGIDYYFGGTLFEAFLVRNQLDDYLRFVDRHQLEYIEISDGCLELKHEEKCEYIQRLSKERKVLSEVGSKDMEKILPPYKWIELMRAELEAGAYKIIAEAREGGNIGIYRSSGEVRMGLIDEILTQIEGSKIIWEAPQKAQQTWFIKMQGANVNLGNIAPNEVIPLETLRLGLRGDTFSQFLNPTIE